MKKTVSLISLGCFRNTYDSEVIIKRFIDEGYAFRRHPKKCNTLIVNTCGFINDAKKESAHCIEEAVSLKKKGKIKRIVVAGCLVVRYKEELIKLFPEVDEFLGVEELTDTVSKRENIVLDHLDVIKISEGCINMCSYCAIPKIKGGLKSKSADTVIKEIKRLERRGVKELNIIGQDITSWGKERYKNKDFSYLLRRIVKETKRIPWIRLLYTHPQHVTDELLEIIAQESRICKYIDLPIQHINDRILKAMNRKTNQRVIKNLIHRIRKKIPTAALRTSVIVGFPGETESEFKELLDFVEEVRFERLGAFMYSREENTPAYTLKPQIPSRLKRKRFNTLMKLQQKISTAWHKEFIGKDITVLVDAVEEGVGIGRTEYSAFDVDGLVYIKRKNIRPGRFYTVQVTDAYEYDLVAH